MNGISANLMNVSSALVLSVSVFGVVAQTQKVGERCDKLVTAQAPIRNEYIHGSVKTFLNNNPDICSTYQGGKSMMWRVSSDLDKSRSLIQIGGFFYLLTKRNDEVYEVSIIKDPSPVTDKEARKDLGLSR